MMSHHFIEFYMSCHVMSFYAISSHVMWCDATSCYFISSHAMSCIWSDLISSHVTPCVMPFHLMWCCHFIWSHVMWRHIMLCHVMSYNVMPFHFMSSRPVLSHAISCYYLMSSHLISPHSTKHKVDLLPLLSVCLFCSNTRWPIMQWIPDNTDLYISPTKYY